MLFRSQKAKRRTSQRYFSTVAALRPSWRRWDAKAGREASIAKTGIKYPPFMGSCLQFLTKGGFFKSMQRRKGRRRQTRRRWGLRSGAADAWEGGPALGTDVLLRVLRVAAYPPFCSIFPICVAFWARKAAFAAPRYYRSRGAKSRKNVRRGDTRGAGASFFRPAA